MRAIGIQRALVVAVVVIAGGCVSATTRGTFPPPQSRDLLAQAHVFVMVPAAAGSLTTGNVGRNLSDIERVVAARVLAIVQERHPDARIADANGQTPYLPMKSYIDAIAPDRTTAEELNAAGSALQHGGTHLLVPAIAEWREMRTDDPIGALIPPHDGIVITFRLVRLCLPAVEGHVTFENHARVTNNQSAVRLLNDDFRRTVLRLVSGAG